MRFTNYLWIHTLLSAFLGASILLLPGCTESRSAQAISQVNASPIRFTSIATEAGLGNFRHFNGGFGKQWMPETVGAGVVFFDYNGDYWQDILLVGGGAFPGKSTASPAVSLYRNNGDGTFTDVTVEVNLGNVSTFAFGVSTADYDNDGDQDFFLSTLYENLLFQNNGGQFVEVGKEAGVSDISAWSASTIFFDADRDGWLDLFVCNYVDWSPEAAEKRREEGKGGYSPEDWEGIRNEFYHNNGDGTFTNRTEASGFSVVPEKQDKSFGVAELDFNNDGWPDLYVTNDTERNHLFRNAGDGTFTEHAIASGVAFDPLGNPRAGMGTDTGVIDSTGNVSIFVGNFVQEMVGIYTHVKDGLFIDRAAASKVGFPTLKYVTFSVLLLDLDLDTDLDVFVGNGDVNYPLEKAGQPVQFFLNEGNGTFIEHQNTGEVPNELIVNRGAAYADFDRDGDFDLLISHNNGPVHLWRNELPDSPFLRIYVQGIRSNRDGLGTRIIAESNGLQMERRIRTGSSFLSASEKVATFGLGKSDSVDRLSIYWPSGMVEEFINIKGGQELLLVEGSGKLIPVPKDTAVAMASR